MSLAVDLWHRFLLEQQQFSNDDYGGQAYFCHHKQQNKSKLRKVSTDYQNNKIHADVLYDQNMIFIVIWIVYPAWSVRLPVRRRRWQG